MPTLVNHWRPITLLNTVFKLYLYLVNQHLESLVAHLLHNSQIGFSKQRWIRENFLLLRLVHDLLPNIDYLKADIIKAYDKDQHSWILTIILMKLN